MATKQKKLKPSFRAQADALEIEAAAKRRLADEYDAAQERGEVARAGGERSGLERSIVAPATKDLGLSRKDIHDARQIRDAEAADPQRVSDIVLRLEALVDAAQRFDKARDDAHEVMAADFLGSTLELVVEQFDALRVALWGEERRP